MPKWEHHLTNNIRLPTVHPSIGQMSMIKCWAEVGSKVRVSMQTVSKERYLLEDDSKRANWLTSRSWELEFKCLTGSLRCRCSRSFASMLAEKIKIYVNLQSVKVSLSENNIFSLHCNNTFNVGSRFTLEKNAGASKTILTKKQRCAWFLPKS